MPHSSGTTMPHIKTTSFHHDDSCPSRAHNCERKPLATTHLRGQNLKDILQPEWLFWQESLTAIAICWRFIGLPRRPRIGVKTFWAQTCEIGEECRQFWTWILGVNFWGSESVRKPAEIRLNNSRKKTLEARWEFAGRSPEVRQTKFKHFSDFTPNPLCRTSGRGVSQEKLASEAYRAIWGPRMK